MAPSTLSLAAIAAQTRPMTITTTKLPLFEAKLRESGLSLPPHFELGVLPSCVLSESFPFSREPEASTLRKVLASEGFHVIDLDAEGARSRIRVEKSSDLLLPALVVAYQVLIDDPERLTTLIEALASYVIERLPRSSSSVSLEVVLQGKGRSYRRVTYCGPAKAIGDLERVIRELSDD